MCRLRRLLGEHGYSRIWTGLAIAIALAGGGIIYQQVQQPSGGGDTGLNNLWIATSPGATPTRCSPACAFDPSLAYGSINAAYQAAQLGDTVGCNPGTYPGETIQYAASKASFSQRVVFDMTGCTVSGTLASAGSQHVEMRNLTTGSKLELRASTWPGRANWLATSNPTKDWLITNSTLKTFLMRNVTDVTVQNSTLGGWDACVTDLGPPKIGAATPDPGVAWKDSQNVTISNNLFHNFIRTSTCSPHAECFYIDSGIDGLLVSGNTMTNCAVMDVHADLIERQVANVTFENNFFDYPRNEDGTYRTQTMRIKGGASNPFVNYTLRYNSFLGNFEADTAGTTFVNPKVYGNTFQGMTDCPVLVPGSAFVNNMMNTSPCGSTDITDTAGYVSSSNATCSGWPQSNFSCSVVNDLHLSSIGSPAVNASTASAPCPANYPCTDIDGTSRPQGSAPDLGADEKG